jgi:hypothetical protein
MQSQWFSFILKSMESDREVVSDGLLNKRVVCYTMHEIKDPKRLDLSRPVNSNHRVVLHQVHSS